MELASLREKLSQLSLFRRQTVVYTVAITAIAQVAFKDRANGSLLVHDGKIIGSALLAQ